MKILEPLYDAVTFVLLAFHSLFKSLGMDPAGGLAWGLSIVGLVIVIRILLIPLFVKQINAQRGLQMLQPEIKKLQAKYKGKTDPESKQKQQKEMMALYKDNGTNPLASCLPIVLQAPIFLSLFRVLNGIGHKTNGNSDPIPRGLLNLTEAKQAAGAQIFGAHISDKFIGATELRVQIITAVLIVLMSATTFTTQKQLMSKNMPASAMDNPFAQQQKLLLYVFPLIFAVSGVNFPIGVLLYWLTTNVWSMGQQFYVIRRNPSPGSPAYDDLERRKAEKAARTAAHERAAGAALPAADGPSGDPAAPNGSPGGPPADGGTGSGNADGSPNGQGTKGPSRQRQQPKRQPKRKR